MKFHEDGTRCEGDNAIFVFGSNLAGRHGAGAALAAKLLFGAEYGVGVGRTGNSYAIPTLDGHLRQLPLAEIESFISNFVAYAKQFPELEFFVTRIGCVLAGRTDADIAPMFRYSPKNCSFADQWKTYLFPQQKFRP